MIPRELIASAQVPGGGTLSLYRRNADFMIVLERDELMSSRMSGSEEALATLACDRLGVNKAPRILVGGYGMGFTLRALLARLGPGARITVAELVPEVIDWARGPMAHLAAGCLDDPRVTIAIGDVGEVIAAGPAQWDAMLLDVDNGPDGLTRADNDALYSNRGLATARAALRPNGTLAIWSAAPDPAFTKRLRGAGFDVEEVKVRARQNGKGPTHTIWLAGR
ncbi:spermidine synthase [Sphingomonas sp. ID0503]|uniref:spermidine synthase n=1 Tax=Sphingomonas sp. ID0503 TaxID=3399691 RepID=UPI003AFA8FCA